LNGRGSEEKASQKTHQNFHHFPLETEKLNKILMFEKKGNLKNSVIFPCV
jgi:hypothetical protein